ncbi:MAG: hypothetical protein GY750_05195 [Lentisphaerae bacterium]|nr:hypothetical protein [Lentisphaerota bacterium]MCP4100809.1 hypothetical protein [Lentisphaerota bacterium]
MIEETTDATRGSSKRKIRKLFFFWTAAFATAWLAILVIFYLTCGILVIRPVIDSEQGSTIVYWRVNSKMLFFCSVDSLLVAKTGDYTICDRGILLTHMVNPLKQRMIAKFSFSSFLYLLSTNGKDYKKDYF